ncbi:MAG: hypothetical protein A3G33_07875 [Omnitrophica bacterium RIFCSPLOWO2_12_FULL_44_17]|uniref:Fe-S oxidoreductase n=1 Tax=Candidatus Danuiimicrobium aquiferis TaxID=1801832 RepID=A0A1G1L2W3_9BACT|nr:MAG: hypothetical protein A3B72_05660 [Omnitrophica bacterium RIFCSPHIGHO2_02_FULL_45_28]OGW92431.1 MAG: hypothetical protein A3E74_04095 [Omnitrophica bacterium RIFCSPHIGHO2_12_FULL_44_12]OGW99520.1 MAG: hypothetical protein A3G33_07875 [Omnitrophica bacterium RIFCSPLOWO2_12_FULL_44_17]OGX02692.1 MAG: hypothetical protein A3J12_06870 [Omnitrophica bacterium RIFCSPLOWO2_02_FULL_44_11]
MSDFSCAQCGTCCRQSGFVYLTAGEAATIAGALIEDIYEFNRKYCDLLDRQKLVLKKHPDETCVFLKETKCEIYSVRPQQCRDFPIKWKTERSAEYCAGPKKSN